MSPLPFRFVAATGVLAAALLSWTIAVELADASVPPASANGSSAALLAERGRNLVMLKGCVGCHTIAGIGGTMTIGPNLSALSSVAGVRKPGVAAQAYVRESIREPQAFIVPGYSGGVMPDLGLTDQEIDAVVAFLLRPR